MSLKHALLGFLNYGPLTGYEVKKAFDAAVGHFWNAELSQIYPALKRLESDGLLEVEVEIQDDRPNRKVYSITDDGRRELVEWLAQPAEADQLREPLMIKIFFGASLPKQDLVRVLRQRAEETRRQLDSLEVVCALTQQFADAMGRPEEGFFWELTCDHGIRNNHANLEWLEEAIRRIETLDDSENAPSRVASQFTDVRRAVEMLEELQAIHLADGEKAGAVNGRDST